MGGITSSFSLCSFMGVYLDKIMILSLSLHSWICLGFFPSMILCKVVLVIFPGAPNCNLRQGVAANPNANSIIIIQQPQGYKRTESFLRSHALKLGQSMQPVYSAYLSVLNRKSSWFKGEGMVFGWRPSGPWQLSVCHTPFSPPAHVYLTTYFNRVKRKFIGEVFHMRSVDSLEGPLRGIVLHCSTCLSSKMIQGPRPVAKGEA